MVNIIDGYKVVEVPQVKLVENTSKASDVPERAVVRGPSADALRHRGWVRRTGLPTRTG